MKGIRYYDDEDFLRWYETVDPLGSPEDYFEIYRIGVWHGRQGKTPFGPEPVDYDDE